jgi:endonuclease/exonuclease/phosphatase family metal-dependent hydrolase
MKYLKKIFASALGFSLTINMGQAMQQDAGVARQFKALSWNIDTNIMRTEEGYVRDSHPEWRASARVPSIKSCLTDLIQKHEPDLIHIQECRKFVNKFGEEVNSLDPYLEHLSKSGYTVHTKKYNPYDATGLSFSYITALKEGFTFQNSQSPLYTKTPLVSTNRQLTIDEIKKNNFGEVWERSPYINFIKDREGNDFCAINNHLGIGLEVRMEASKLLNEWVSDIVKKNKNIRVIVSGDFNSFPAWGGPEQINIIKEAGILKSATEELKVYSTEEKIASTFFFFPYDFGAFGTDNAYLKSEEAKLPQFSPKERKERIADLFKNEAKALGGHLDHVFYRGFTNAESYLVPTPLFGDVKGGYTEKSVKKYVLENHSKGPAFASDHQPILSLFTL